MDTQPQQPAPDPIETVPGVRGFFATEPEFSHTDSGVPKVYARYGVERSRLEDDGTRTRLEPTFHSIVFYWRAAEIVRDQFQLYDHFVAQGEVRTNKATGKERFVAYAIGHNTLRTRYEVDRSLKAPVQPAPAHRPERRSARPQTAAQMQGMSR